MVVLSFKFRDRGIRVVVEGERVRFVAVDIFWALSPVGSVNTMLCGLNIMPGQANLVDFPGGKERLFMVIGMSDLAKVISSINRDIGVAFEVWLWSTVIPVAYRVGSPDKPERNPESDKELSRVVAYMRMLSEEIVELVNEIHPEPGPDVESDLKFKAAPIVEVGSPPWCGCTGCHCEIKS